MQAHHAYTRLVGWWTGTRGGGGGGGLGGKSLLCIFRAVPTVPCLGTATVPCLGTSTVPCLGTFAVPAWVRLPVPCLERLPVPCLERLPVPCLERLPFPAWARLPTFKTHFNTIRGINDSATAAQSWVDSYPGMHSTNLLGMYHTRFRKRL